jgi:hypothetical protein
VRRNETPAQTAYCLMDATAGHNTPELSVGVLVTVSDGFYGI